MVTAMSHGRWVVIGGFVAMAVVEAAVSPAAGRLVEVAAKPGMPFVRRDTTTLADLPPLPVDAPLDRFGGLESRPASPGTGFFARSGSTAAGGSSIPPERSSSAAA